MSVPGHSASAARFVNALRFSDAASTRLFLLRLILCLQSLYGPICLTLQCARANQRAMAKVKICGVRDEALVHVAAEAGADWIGFNLVPKSPRFIAPHGESVPERLNDLLKVSAEAQLRSVVLVVDPDIAVLKSLTDTVLPDAIQLHGQETPEFVAKLRAAMTKDTEVWKAVGVENRADLEAVARFVSADRLLIDAKPPEGADRTGGHGQAFDWSILRGWAAPKPWMLAGGLTPENVATAIAATGADAVDVSSGVESERGVKDEVLIRSFIAAAKAA